VNTIGSYTPLGELLAHNQASEPTAPTTTIANAQQTFQQAPAQILSALAPANTSLYGAAASVDSLLGNIGTSRSLITLSQINSSRSTSSQIDPFGSVSDAVEYATLSKAQSAETLLASSLNEVDGNSLGLLSAYFSHPKLNAETSGLSFNVTG